ncbi:MarR family transcriptional regulator [Listeria monocytogenes]|nr:MarR family transcriptional regulator [Listeria monocytogenes]
MSLLKSFLFWHVFAVTRLAFFCEGNMFFAPCLCSRDIT